MTYLLSIVYSLYSILIYFLFRMGVSDFLLYNKHSKTYIRKNEKGFVNYWLYQKLHRDGDLGLGYFLNAALLFATIAFFLFSLCFGCLKWADSYVYAFSAVLCLLQIAAVAYYCICSKLFLFRTPFVLLRRSPDIRRGIESTVFDIALLCIHIAFWYACTAL